MVSILVTLKLHDLLLELESLADKMILVTPTPDIVVPGAGLCIIDDKLNKLQLSETLASER